MKITTTLILSGVTLIAMAAIALPGRHSVNRAHKQDRLSATFAQRWDAIKDIDPATMPALHQWMAEHGVPVVAQGN